MLVRSAIDIFFGAFALVFLLHELEEKSPVSSPVTKSIHVQVQDVTSRRACAIAMSLEDNSGDFQNNFNGQFPGGVVDTAEKTCSVIWAEELDIDTVEELNVSWVSGYYEEERKNAKLFINGELKADFCLSENGVKVKPEITASVCSTLP